jgi:hypothetical protein
MFAKVTDNALRYFACITGLYDANDSRYAEKFQSCVVLLSQPLESNVKARPACLLFSRKLCPSDGTTGRSRQVWDRAIAEATKPVRFVLSIDLGNESPKTALRRGKTSRSSIMHEPHSLLGCQWDILSRWGNSSI